jgi:hypothetical protein
MKPSDRDQEAHYCGGSWLELSRYVGLGSDYRISLSARIPDLGFRIVRLRSALSRLLDGGRKEVSGEQKG